MRTLSTTAVLVALAVTTPGAALGASAAGGLKLERAVYADAAEIPLRRPEGVACDESGALIVADTGNARLVVYRWKDGALDGGAQVKLSQLTYPTRLQIDSKGFVLALDRRTKKIVRVDAKGGFAGVVELPGGSAPTIPASFKIDRADRLYVLDVVAAKVIVLSPDGKLLRELPLPKEAPGVTDVAVDSAERVYVVDAVSATVFAADPGATAFRPLPGHLTEMLSFPTYLTADGGKLYVVDQNGHAVVRLGNDGTFQGRELAGGQVEGAVSYPAQLCLNAEGEAFVADRANNRVQIFALPR